MFKPSIYYPPNTFLNFMLTAALLALPFLSAQAQRILQSKPCFQAWPNTLAKCKGFILCDNGNRYTLVTGTAISAKSCPGWVVWNQATVTPQPLSLATKAWSTLQVPSGIPLDTRSSNCTCTGVKTTLSARINSCPTSPIAGSDRAENSVFDNSPSTSAACLAAGMFWSSFYQTCFEQSEDGCELGDGFWDFTSSTCSETPESLPTNQEDCEDGYFYWNPVGDYCQSHPPPPCYLSPPESCFNGGTWDPVWCGCIIPSTPILVDVAGDGFDLTNATGGTTFNLNATGGREKLAWTRYGSDDAWLALDRNGNGTIDDGTELFGDVTAQPETSEGEKKNGFRALAEFDKLANGGNADGQIDGRDSIFSSLRLWQDANHNGVSDFGELHPLSALSIIAFELDYTLSKKMDSNGNQFGFRAKVWSSKDQRLGRWAWDVYLVKSE
jgi:hypothetical protein